MTKKEAAKLQRKNLLEAKKAIKKEIREKKVDPIEPPPKMAFDFQTDLHARLAEILVTHRAPKRKFSTDESREEFIQSHA